MLEVVAVVLVALGVLANALAVVGLSVRQRKMQSDIEDILDLLLVDDDGNGGDEDDNLGRSKAAKQKLADLGVN